MVTQVWQKEILHKMLLTGELTATRYGDGHKPVALKQVRKKDKFMEDYWNDNSY